MKKIIRRLKNSIRERIELWDESYLKLRLTCPVRMPTHEERTISVAIPFFNNSSMVHVALFNIINDPRVAEIIILDDGSLEEAFQKLVKKMKPFSSKVKLFRRETNWGAFANKIQAIELCCSNWVILLDSDNTVLPEYLDAIFHIQEWDETTIYCSGYAYPHFNFKKELGGKVIDLDLASSMIQSQTFNRSFFNDGNYFLPKQHFLNAIKPFWQYSVAASDVAFANYLWLSSNKTLTVLHHSKYIHRIHEGSSWLNSSEQSLRVIEPILKRIQAKISPNSERLRDDFSQVSREWIEPTLIVLR